MALKPYSPSRASLGIFEEDKLIPTTKVSAEEVRANRKKMRAKREIERRQEEKRLKEESFKYYMESFEDE